MHACACHTEDRTALGAKQHHPCGRSRRMASDSRVCRRAEAETQAESRAEHNDEESRPPLHSLRTPLSRLPWHRIRSELRCMRAAMLGTFGATYPMQTSCHSWTLRRSWSLQPLEIGGLERSLVVHIGKCAPPVEALREDRL